MVAHEYAHARVALSQGDDTAYLLGRVTLNPRPHIDPWLTLLVPAMTWIVSKGTFAFGGAKPVPVMPRKFRHYVRGDLLVSAAGVTTNLLISIACAVIFLALSYLGRTMPDSAQIVDVLQRMMMWGVYLNLLLCFFNLIPVPPLDGSKLVYHVLPPKLGSWYRSLDRFGYIFLFALMFLGGPVLGWLLAPVRYGTLLFVRYLSPYGVGDGWNIFR